MDEEELKKMREADAVASGLFGGAAFQPIPMPNFPNRIPSERNLLPPSQLTTPTIPEFPRLSPLVRTDYGLPPSERPEYRDPALQWDARQTRTASTTPIPMPPMPSGASVGQNLVTQQPVRNTVLPATLTQNRVIPDRPSYNQIQTPYGTVFASTETPKEGGPSQASNQRVMEMGYLPEQSARLANIGEQAQRNAAIAQMRQRGATLARQSIERQEQFFAQKRAERAALAQATGEAYKAGMSPQSVRQARSAYTSQQPTSIAGIQRQFAQMAPSFRSPMSERTAFVRSPFNIPSGGPQPNQGMNFASPTPILDNERFGNPFSFNFGYGV